MDSPNDLVARQVARWMTSWKSIELKVVEDHQFHIKRTPDARAIAP